MSEEIANCKQKYLTLLIIYSIMIGKYTFFFKLTKLLDELKSMKYT